MFKTEEQILGTFITEDNTQVDAQYFVVDQSEKAYWYQQQGFYEEGTIERLNTGNVYKASFEEKQDICKRRDIFFLCDDDVKHLKKRIISRRILFDKEGMVKINKGDKNYEEIIVVNSWEEVGKVGVKLVC